jgi:hypothetical protein
MPYQIQKMAYILHYICLETPTELFYMDEEIKYYEDYYEKEKEKQVMSKKFR